MLSKRQWGKQIYLDMYAKYIYNACMKQYTVRGISETIDATAREKSKKLGKSLNSVLLDALSRGLGVEEKAPVYNDMDDLSGTWIHDPDTESALEDFEKIDKSLWENGKQNT